MLKEVEHLRRVWDLLDLYEDEPVSPDFAARVLAGAGTARPRRRLVLRPRLAAAAAAVLLLTAGGLSLLATRPGSPRTATRTAPSPTLSALESVPAEYLRAGRRAARPLRRRVRGAPRWPTSRIRGRTAKPCAPPPPSSVVVLLAVAGPGLGGAAGPGRAAVRPRAAHGRGAGAPRGPGARLDGPARRPSGADRAERAAHPRAARRPSAEPCCERIERLKHGREAGAGPAPGRLEHQLDPRRDAVLPPARPRDAGGGRPALGRALRGGPPRRSTRRSGSPRGGTASRWPSRDVSWVGSPTSGPGTACRRSRVARPPARARAGAHALRERAEAGDESRAAQARPHLRVPRPAARRRRAGRDGPPDEAAVRRLGARGARALSRTRSPRAWPSSCEAAAERGVAAGATRPGAAWSARRARRDAARSRRAGCSRRSTSPAACSRRYPELKEPAQQLGARCAGSPARAPVPIGGAPIARGRAATRRPGGRRGPPGARVERRGPRPPDEAPDVPPRAHRPTARRPTRRDPTTARDSEASRLQSGHVPSRRLPADPTPFGEVDSQPGSPPRRWLAGVDADLVVLPELFATGYAFRDRAEALGAGRGAGRAAPDRRLPGAPRARARAAWSSVVSLERDGDAALQQRGGRRRGRAASRLPQAAPLRLRARDSSMPGDGRFPVVEHAGPRVGVMICFDWIFPEAARILALEGADVIAHPSNLVLPWCQRAMPIRALENGVYTVTANRIGEEHRPPRPDARASRARSLIVSPLGESLAEGSGRRRGGARGRRRRRSAPETRRFLRVTTVSRNVGPSAYGRRFAPRRVSMTRVRPVSVKSCVNAPSPCIATCLRSCPR